MACDLLSWPQTTSQPPCACTSTTPCACHVGVYVRCLVVCMCVCVLDTCIPNPPLAPSQCCSMLFGSVKPWSQVDYPLHGLEALPIYVGLEGFKCPCPGTWPWVFSPGCILGTTAYNPGCPGTVPLHISSPTHSKRCTLGCGRMWSTEKTYLIFIKC